MVVTQPDKPAGRGKKLVAPPVKVVAEEAGLPVAQPSSARTPEFAEQLRATGADVAVVSRRGQTTVDMANGPVQRISPFPETIELLERLGARNNHNCVSC